MGEVNREFKSWIKEYIEIDNKIKEANTKLASVRKQKKNIESKISDYIVEHDLEDIAFNIPENGSVKLGSTTTIQPITKELLFEKINEILKDEKLTKQCVDHVYESREKVEKQCIKRSKRQLKK